jgi:hypothetical protein
MAEVPLLTDRGLLGQDSEDTELRKLGKGLIHSDEENPKGNFLTQKKRPMFQIRHHNDRFEGWKFTIFLAFLASLTVLFFNIGFVLYSRTHGGQTNTVLYKGDCGKVHRLNIGFHLLINVLSTALLGASNFGMVCISGTLALSWHGRRSNNFR